MPRNSDEFSARVRLQLVIAGQWLELAQVGPHTGILRQPRDLPPCEAEVVMQVDGHERRWPVYLPDGASAQSPSLRLQDR